MVALIEKELSLRDQGCKEMLYAIVHGLISIDSEINKSLINKEWLEEPEDCTSLSGKGRANGKVSDTHKTRMTLQR